MILRIVFLFSLFLTAILFTLRKGPALDANDIRQIILDFLLIPAAALTVATFGFLLTRTDPLPLIREGAYQMSLKHNISFAQAIPQNLQDNLEVVSVEREDTDGDLFEEWVVFYRFDLQTGDKSPIQAAIYDNDRGNPPVIFPYQLRPPGRDYLSEDARSLEFEMEQVTEDNNGPDNNPNLTEILISSSNQLAIFRFKENSEIWDFPRDAPPRYRPIGFFRGNGGVAFNDENKNVTVIDRNGFERSQLSVRSIYALKAETNSYWDTLEPLGADQEATPQLAAPIVSTIDFYPEPPQDILDSAFPEKIVLAFYASTCGEQDETLCRNAEDEWTSEEFVAEDAFMELDNENAAYFGLPNFDSVRDLSVTHLRYYPSLETDSDLLTSGGGRDVVTGEQAQFNLVDITFTVGDAPLESARYQMGLVEGRWKILRRVALDPLVLESPTEIPNQ